MIKKASIMTKISNIYMKIKHFLIKKDLKPEKRGTASDSLVHFPCKSGSA